MDTRGGELVFKLPSFRFFCPDRLVKCPLPSSVVYLSCSSYCGTDPRKMVSLVLGADAWALDEGLE